jgi:hypothetical protein
MARSEDNYDPTIRPSRGQARTFLIVLVTMQQQDSQLARIHRHQLFVKRHR